jgi:hypothetical protein
LDYSSRDDSNISTTLIAGNFNDDDNNENRNDDDDDEQFDRQAALIVRYTEFDSSGERSSMHDMQLDVELRRPRVTALARFGAALTCYVTELVAARDMVR